MSLTYGGLFEGIGGIGRGLEAVGMRCAWQVEWDERLRELLASYWPDARRFGDVRSVSGADLGYVDVVAGGFPCQPISQAGERRGRADERWLWPEFARVVRDLRPRYVLVENVAALLRPYEWPKRSGRWWAAPVEDVLGDLAALGYDAEWTSLRASDVGAPHERERVFVVAYPDGGGRLHRSPRIFAGDALEQALADARARCAAVADSTVAGWSGRQGSRGPRGRGEPTGGGPLADHRLGRREAGTDVDPRRWSEGERASECGLADPDRLDGRVPDRRQDGQTESEAPRGGRALARTDERRREQHNADERGVPEPHTTGRSAEPGLGRDADGLPGRLHGWPGWPSRPGEAQYAYEPPRTTTAKGREARLRALGNAVVPQLAEVIGRLIVADATR